MTTDSGLAFTGDAYGNFLALGTNDGRTLWHTGTGSPMATSPITYMLDGRQYVVTGSGGVMFAWALPEAATGSVAATTVKVAGVHGGGSQKAGSAKALAAVKHE